MAYRPGRAEKSHHCHSASPPRRRPAPQRRCAGSCRSGRASESPPFVRQCHSLRGVAGFCLDAFSIPLPGAVVTRFGTFAAIFAGWTLIGVPCSLPLGLGRRTLRVGSLPFSFEGKRRRESICPAFPPAPPFRRWSSIYLFRRPVTAPGSPARRHGCAR